MTKQFDVRWGRATQRCAGVTKIALLSFVILVAGCASQEERLLQQDARDDSTCKKSSPHGTESYWKCRSQLGQMHAQQQ